MIPPRWTSFQQQVINRIACQHGVPVQPAPRVTDLAPYARRFETGRLAVQLSKALRGEIS